MKPINKYIIIKKINEEVETESGLLLSSKDVSDMRYAKADVVKVGTNVDTVLEGQTIYFDKSSGHTLLINNEPYTIIREADVVVVL
jgi:co-chaperonin GroES (HSP10)